MVTQDGELFRDLPPFTVSQAERLVAGQVLDLLLLEYGPTGGGVAFSVSYVHRRLTFRVPGKKDAFAFGTASLSGHDSFAEVRILFSQPRETATLRGLPLEGQVKIWPN